jgi:hypothetical protein
VDRWDPEVVGTVKRKRASGISNTNGIKKEIEVIYFICKKNKICILIFFFSNLI